MGYRLAQKARDGLEIGLADHRPDILPPPAVKDKLEVNMLFRHPDQRMALRLFDVAQPLLKIRAKPFKIKLNVMAIGDQMTVRGAQDRKLLVRHHPGVVSIFSGPGLTGQGQQICGFDTKGAEAELTEAAGIGNQSNHQGAPQNGCCLSTPQC